MPLSAEQTAPITAALTFINDETLIYNYQTTQRSTQQINDDTLQVESDIAWRFALRCTAQDSNTATLQLSILAIKASVNAPNFVQSIDTSLDVQQQHTPVIGHLVLLNGKTLTFTFDLQQQRLSEVQGGDSIRQAFRQQYPKDAFSDEENPQFLQAQQQFSDTALLRLWREIIRPPQTGDEHITLDPPLNLPIVRKWQDADADGIASYHMQPYDANTDAAADTVASPDAHNKAAPDQTNTATAQSPIMVILSGGPNPVQAQLRQLTASGKVLLRDGAVSEATGQINAQMNLIALSTALRQDLDLSWQLLLVKRIPASQSSAK